MRLIDADEFINRIKESEKMIECIVPSTKRAEQFINQIDFFATENSIDVPLKIDAKWVKFDYVCDGHPTYYCSNCRAVLEDYMYRYNNFYHCYHCGAKMKNPFPCSLADFS
jgi:hypothetical protein